MKSRAILYTTAILTVLSVGCAKQPAKSPTTPTKIVQDVEKGVIVTADTFGEAISSTGKGIVSLTNDLTIDKDLVVNGEFKNDKNNIERKIYLYDQEKDKSATAKFALTVPKLTINSPNTSIEHGTIIGDIYVSSNNFQLIDTTVDGNIYFTNDEAKATFKMDDISKVTGNQELKK